jgi:siroheme synthase
VAADLTVAAVLTHAQLQEKLISLGAARLLAAAVVSLMDYLAVESIVLTVPPRKLTVTVDRKKNLYGLGAK